MRNQSKLSTISDSKCSWIRMNAFNMELWGQLSHKNHKNKSAYLLGEAESISSQCPILHFTSYQDNVSCFFLKRKNFQRNTFLSRHVKYYTNSTLQRHSTSWVIFQAVSSNTNCYWFNWLYLSLWILFLIFLLFLKFWKSQQRNVYISKKVYWMARFSLGIWISVHLNPFRFIVTLSSYRYK